MIWHNNICNLYPHISLVQPAPPFLIQIFLFTNFFVFRSIFQHCNLIWNSLSMAVLIVAICLLVLLLHNSLRLHLQPWLRGHGLSYQQWRPKFVDNTYCHILAIKKISLGKRKAIYRGIFSAILYYIKKLHCHLIFRTFEDNN